MNATREEALALIRSMNVCCADCKHYRLVEQRVGELVPFTASYVGKAYQYTACCLLYPAGNLSDDRRSCDKFTLTEGAKE